MTLKSHGRVALEAGGLHLIHGRGSASVVIGADTLGVVTLEDLGIGVTKLDGNVTLELSLETDSLREGRRAVVRN